MGAGHSQLSSRHLTKEKLRTLERKFVRVSGGDGKASIEDIQKLPELAGNPMIPRIFKMIDTDGDGSLTLQEFVRAVEWFGTLKTAEQMYQLAFSVYDLDGDGKIGAEELYTMLKSILGEAHNYTEQQLEHVVHSTMLQYDADGDWQLNYKEFKQLMNTTDLFSKFTFTVC